MRKYTSTPPLFLALYTVRTHHIMQVPAFNALQKLLLRHAENVKSAVHADDLTRGASPGV